MRNFIEWVELLAFVIVFVLLLPFFIVIGGVLLVGGALYKTIEDATRKTGEYDHYFKW